LPTGNADGVVSVKLFKVDTTGLGEPVGNTVMKPSASPLKVGQAASKGWTVEFREKALAVDGIPHPELGIENARVELPASTGLP